MIIQGSNSPITLTFDEDMTSTTKLSVALIDKSRNIMKHWNLNDVQVSGAKIVLPLQEHETLNFKVGKCRLEAKWINGGNIQLNDVIEMVVSPRYDATRIGGV